MTTPPLPPFQGTRRYDTGDVFGAVLTCQVTEDNQYEVAIHASYDGFIRRRFFTRAKADEYIDDMISHNFYIHPHDHVPVLIEEIP